MAATAMETVVQLTVASESLRNVLLQAVQQPEGVQMVLEVTVRRLLDSLRCVEWMPVHGWHSTWAGLVCGELCIAEWEGLLSESGRNCCALTC
jgi:hypothetical protein